ncbi:LytR/AlgR family response regulator transcription factor [Bacteroidota bacterium]
MLKTVYKTILIDDEALAVERLQRMLEPFSSIIEIIDTAYNGEEAIKKINNQKPELIFLDIQMPEINGFAVLQQITHNPIVIFTTAFDQYALKAFETNSIDYLLKPITSKRLEESIEKLTRLTDKDHIHKQIKALLNNIGTKQTQWIQVKIGDKVRFVKIRDIYFLKAEDKYVDMHTFDQHYLLNNSLTALKTDLSEDFVRIHRSSIINLNFVDEIIKMSNNLYEVRMKDKNQTRLAVSRKLKSNLGL